MKEKLINIVVLLLTARKLYDNIAATRYLFFIILLITFYWLCSIGSSILITVTEFLKKIESVKE